MRDDHSGADDEHFEGAGSALELFEGFRRRGSVRERYANTFRYAKLLGTSDEVNINYHNGDAAAGEQLDHSLSSR